MHRRLHPLRPQSFGALVGPHVGWGLKRGFPSIQQETTFSKSASAESFVVDRGTDLGFPFEGQAPDLGAFEFGAEPWKLEDLPKAR
jgi:hypothetical protein